MPRKNLRAVAGRPLIAYTLEAAAASRQLTHFVTSTDDPEIAAVAGGLGSPVLLRPPELARDDTPMAAVIQHALARQPADAPPVDFVVVLQPTSPLRTADDIDAAIDLLAATGADSVVSVYRVEDHHPARMYRLRDGCLEPYEPEPANRLRQELPAVYHRNGAVYACRRTLVEQGTLLGGVLRPYLMPRERSLNIDDEVDLALAELLLRRRGETAGAGSSTTPAAAR